MFQLVVVRYLFYASFDLLVLLVGLIELGLLNGSVHILKQPLSEFIVLSVDSCILLFSRLKIEGRPVRLN